MKIALSRACSNEQGRVFYMLSSAISSSRFTAKMTCETARTIKILDVRLKAAKPYCGSHPNACEIGGVDKKARFLEGADWVEFNDLLNNVLDKLNIDAKVASISCILRKGKLRRVEYGSVYVGNQFQWSKDEESCCYEDFCGKIAPPSTFPNGTPGIYTRTGYNMVG